MHRSPLFPIVVFFVVIMCVAILSFPSQAYTTLWNMATRLTGQGVINFLCGSSIFIFVIWLFINIAPIISGDISRFVDVMEASMSSTTERYKATGTASQKGHRVRYHDEDEENFQQYRDLFPNAHVYREYDLRKNAYTIYYVSTDMRKTSIQQEMKRGGGYVIKDMDTSRTLYEGDARGTSEYLKQWRNL